ncbi:hypothetical protein [Pseudoalteromonas sp. T1lg75]|uniref:hypothetical protein n=1 Tax=Pseudoalteromonas sp. T1lg75 TaxID=2077102 RepID=UPI000CF6A67D|nr:hypothetical protein [Pseudoalteromonas sp. T1lg75]
MNLRDGKFKKEAIEALEANNIPELISVFAEELEKEGSAIIHGAVNGIPSPSNGELGFLTKRAGFTFAVYARKTGRVNVRVVDFDESVSASTVEKLLHPRQEDEKKYNGPRFYALPGNADSYRDKETAKAKLYEFISMVEN